MERIKNIFTSMHVPDGEPAFHDKRYVPKKLSDKNFTPVKCQAMRIAYMDGGNAEIISSPSFALNFIRINFCIFNGSRHVSPGIKSTCEFYAAAYTSEHNGEICYKTAVLPINGDFLPTEKSLTFSITDKTLMDGIFMVRMEKLGQVARHFAEWKAMTSIAQNESVDAVIKDGTLQAGVTNDENYLNNIYKAALQKNVIVGSVAKSSSMFTTTGKDLLYVIGKMTTEKQWCYHPIVHVQNPQHRSEIAAVKLNEHATHAFRLEIFNKQFTSDVLKRVAEGLATNSRDPRFPGYPYGLLKAHQLAKITLREVEYHRSRFRSLIRSSAHDALDRLEN